jgi:hypothetical protein
MVTTIIGLAPGAVLEVNLWRGVFVKLLDQPKKLKSLS